MASRELLLAPKALAQSGEVTRVTDAITTDAQYEGNGFAGTLMHQGENLLQKSIQLLELPPFVIHFLTDNARGQTTDRAGWSTHQAKKLGFSDKSSELVRLFGLLGEDISSEELSHTLYKVYNFSG